MSLQFKMSLRKMIDPFALDDIAEKVLSILNSSASSKMGNKSHEIVKKANYSDSADAFLRAANALIQS